ncbi:MAG TPA: hypothetical protein VKP69_18915 [Isosphaeraceae bacterium]|nr:hypothetical protein [Isosphaeraceae bacterium]
MSCPGPPAVVRCLEEAGTGAADPPNVGADAGFVSPSDGRSLAGQEASGDQPDTCGRGWYARRLRPRRLARHSGRLRRLRARLEPRPTPEGNSGVYPRAPADNSHISRIGMEIQLLDEYRPRYQGINSEGEPCPPGPGSLRRPAPRPGPDAGVVGATSTIRSGWPVASRAERRPASGRPDADRTSLTGYIS